MYLDWNIDLDVSQKRLLLAGSRRMVEKAMATHSSTLTWRVPWAEEPGGLPSMVFHRVGHD